MGVLQRVLDKMSRTPRNLRAPEDPLGTPGGPTLPPSDDEDSDGRSHSAMSYKERRREAHTQAEQKRRDSIKKGYEYLQDLVPSINEDGTPSTSNAKASKAVVLQKAIEHIQQIEGQKRKQEEDVNGLRKELASLKVIRDTYEELVKVHQTSTSGGGGENSGFVSSETKFRIFQMLMDSLFMSFNDKVSMNSFPELSRCVISWLEESCTPYVLQELMLNILDQVKTENPEVPITQQNQRISRDRINVPNA